MKRETSGQLTFVEPRNNFRYVAYGLSAVVSRIPNRDKRQDDLHPRYSFLEEAVRKTLTGTQQ